MNSIIALMSKHRVATIASLSFLTGVAIASVSLIPAGIAQTGTPSNNCPGPHHMGRGNPLNLTEEQEDQMEAIRDSTRERIDAVLTDEQRASLEAARAAHERRRGDFEVLNLTDEQQAQIDAIHEAAQAQMSSILTPEQLQQWQQFPGPGGPSGPGGLGGGPRRGS